MGEAEDLVQASELNLKDHDSSLEFQFDPRSIRSRYQLEGLDSIWHPTFGEGKFEVRFLDENRNQFSRATYFANGETPGWTGETAFSDFQEKSALITVPEGARFLSLSMSSSGPPATVGIYAITGIKIESTQAMTKNGILTQVLEPLQNLEDWNQSGTHPSMAGSVTIQSAKGDSNIIEIRDDDISAHADWEMRAPALPMVTPGDLLSVSWKEAYSIGMGGPQSVSYDRLPPGEYRFVVEELDLTGIKVDSQTEVLIRVTRPYWEETWFWLLMLLLVGILSSMLGRSQIRRRVQREQRHAQLISNERLRIAGDLHDDLGTRLSHMHLLGSHAEESVNDESAKEALQRINHMAGELIGSLSETVWMLNANNGNLESLVDFLCRLVDELCRLADIRCRIDALSVDEETPISHEFRHNFSLAVKETINNVLKHSEASEIRMKITRTDDLFTVVVADNGVELGEQTGRTGSGLKNVARRMNSINGFYELKNLPRGVEVTLSAPITT